jgi:ubiquinol-cytochrome c reductase iron-sulfur subunit
MSDGDGGLPRRLPKLVGALLAGRAVRAAIERRRAGAAQPPAAPAETGPSPAAEQVDPSERDVPSDRRAETLVAVLLALAGLFGFGFTAAYVLEGTNAQYLGLAIGGCLALLAAACIVAGKRVVPQETHVEERGLLLKEDEVDEVAEIVEEGGEGISRRALLTGAAGLAGAGVLTAAATPLASLGPRLRGIHYTPWHRGVRLVDDRGDPYPASTIEVGTFYTALPEHGDPESFGAGLLVVRLPPAAIQLPAARRGWAPYGILAYSKICPHAGCAISLYRYPTYQPTSNGPAFTCPCHYSTFLPGEGGRVVFGPAGRALPQLPLMVDGEGYLRAADGFHEDIGPSWWNVRRSES